MIWSCDTCQQIPCFDSCQLTWISDVIKMMWTLLSTNPAWLRPPCLRNAGTTATAVRDSTHLWAIPLAMLTMKKETLGFHNFYARFSFYRYGAFRMLILTAIFSIMADFWWSFNSVISTILSWTCKEFIYTTQTSTSILVLWKQGRVIKHDYIKQMYKTT